MKCPKCGKYNFHRIISTKSYIDRIKRRRECMFCKERFTTYERIKEDENVRRDN